VPYNFPYETGALGGIIVTLKVFKIENSLMLAEADFLVRFPIKWVLEIMMETAFFQWKHLLLNLA
jgi:hypothetical protein